MKLRHGPDGVHLFDRISGLNVLLDEISVAEKDWAKAPRFVSFALTNVCDLKCSFCYAPKDKSQLNFEDVCRWCEELDENGCLGIGFGGGEPTLYADFESLCQEVAGNMNLSVGFTTHAHQFSEQTQKLLEGFVHFIRVSMDGVESTYERIRKRPFPHFVEKLRLIADIAPFGINYVVNDDTINDIQRVAEFAEAEGAEELLFLPDRSANSLSSNTIQRMKAHVSNSHETKMRFAISESSPVDGIPLADPFIRDVGARAYIHVNANGKVLKSSFQQTNGIQISNEPSLLTAISKLEGETE